MSITTVELNPWSDAQLRDYLNRDGKGTDGARVAEALQRLSSEDRELLKRPFFASQFERFIKSGDGSAGDADLLEHLITAYIEREAAKIVNANGDPVLPGDGHRHLFELAVGEMWDNEARQLSVNDLKTIAELVSEEFDLDADQATQLKAKVTSYAGFRPRGSRHESQANFVFEHEVYFDDFLASAMQRLLREARLDELARTQAPTSAASVTNLGATSTPRRASRRCLSASVRLPTRTSPACPSTPTMHRS